MTRRPLITDHWFREGPDETPGSGYWICGWPGCGEHRADHAQAEGHWRAEVHPFRPQRINPPRCHTCGFHRSQTRHLLWTWASYDGGAAAWKARPPFTVAA